MTDGKEPIGRHTSSIAIHPREIIIDPVPLTATTPPWIVFAWAPVLWQASSATQLHLVHLSTRVLSLGDSHGPCCGQTLWGDASDEHATGVAWDWVELPQGVVAMADPFGVVTNLRLIGAQGEFLSQSQAAVHLHPLVHALPWQREVRRVLDQPA